MYRWSRESSNKVTIGKISTQHWQNQQQSAASVDWVGTEGEKLGAKYTEAEVQGMTLGLKREHKERLTEMQKLHEEEMFKVRGEKAVSVEYYVKKIQVCVCVCVCVCVY